MSLTVEDVMKSSVITIETRFTARQAAKLMDYRGVSSLVVTFEGKLVGIVTEKDLVTRVIAKGLDSEKVLVEDIMTAPVMVVHPESPLEGAVQVMLSQGIKKLPVLGGMGKGDLVGIMSLTDVAMIYPAVYATMKQLQQAQDIRTEKGIDFYIS